MLELGRGNAYQPENVAVAEDGFRGLAQHLGILEGPARSTPQTLRTVSRRGWITAGEGGMFVPRTRAGELVRAGESIGDLYRFDGSVTPVAPFTRDGILIGLRNDPVVHTGERLAFVAWEWADRPVAPRP